MVWVVAIAGGGVVAAAAVAWTLQHQKQRQRALVELLDAADALEARLREARNEIESVSDSANDPVQSAMREILRQRLWVQQHGKTATLKDLHQVRDALRQARDRVEVQLARVEQARMTL